MNAIQSSPESGFGGNLIARGLGALVGFLVFGGIFAYALYAVSQKPEAPPKVKAKPHAVVLSATKPPPKKKTQRKQPKRAKKAASKSLAPPPVGGGLAGQGFGLTSDFDMGGGQDLTNDLVGDTSNVILTADTLDAQPQRLNQVVPTYSSSLKRRGIEGHVDVSIVIDMSGRVTSAKVITADPPDVFNESAIRAAKKMRFTKPTKNGQAVTTRKIQGFDYTLGEE